jgi:hypothetical protein
MLSSKSNWRARRCPSNLTARSIFLPASSNARQGASIREKKSLSKAESARILKRLDATNWFEIVPVRWVSAGT